MSSPRGGSPGAEHRSQHDTNNPALQNDGADINDSSATSITEQEVNQPSAGAPRAEMEAGNTVLTDGSEDDRLASQVSLLAVQDSASPETIPADQTRHVDSTFPPQQPQIANMPPRSTSHMDPLQRPIDLNHSLPPTPREEQPSHEFPSSVSRADRRRSSVMFQEQEDSPSVASGSSVPRDHNLERQGSLPAPVSDGRRTQYPSAGVQHSERGEEPEFVLPRWQPDAEVTYCPICQTQFSIFVRKHHCRKCGRVVCNSCSPHRIIIPHQYIVRPPGYEVLHPPAYLYEGLAGGYMDGYGPAGGERVRLCNPCVPDPQTAPPQSPTGAVGGGSGRSAHQRSRSSFGSGYGTWRSRWSQWLLVSSYTPWFVAALIATRLFLPGSTQFTFRSVIFF
ncbi:FYVE zinc finger domain-containing protein [Sarocladium implicatum]|nr:FYVE zinc finger domain-containing protein [Sarocladium implicatum]